MNDSGAGLAIEAKGLVKVFGSNRVVDGVDLAIPKGSVYGFLGHNGAGKTTTIRMLSTLLPMDGGTVKVFGHDLAKEPHEVRGQISLAGQYASLDEDLTGYENLVMIARLVGYSRKRSKMRAQELLRVFGLEEAAKRQVKTYSGGMRRRIDIAGSIVVTPRILFLDEPTTGLDPQSRNQVWEIVRALASVGTTVLLTTQYLEEADRLADRIAVMKQGRIIAEGTSNELKSSVGSRMLHIRLVHEEESERAKAMLSDKVALPVRSTTDL
ncbi:ATP-binding cassette domain-containing protein [Bacillus sp. JCM 19034]|uniref:ATP-binding cassette domain-containing protein n=1 Tax=Bacillus sp. JCM 19034 TaxID=1481928 RepID=UPI000AE37ECB